MKRSPPTTAREDTSRRGLTLIELLVVLAIVSLLVAILLPSFGRARSSAMLMRCSSNLRSLATAWVNYVNDHHGYFYQAPNANVNYGGWRGLKDEKSWWPRPLNPWMGLRDPNDATEHTATMFCCPADRGGIPDDYFLETVYRAHGTSYQTNIFLVGPDSCKPFSERTKELDLEIAARLPHLNAVRVANHSRIAMIGDYGWVNQWDPTPFRYSQWKERAEWHRRDCGHNLAFLDGHVDLLTVRKGYYVTDEYCVLPFEDLYDLAGRVQGPAE